MYFGQYTLNLDLICKLSMEQLLELNTAVANEFKTRLLKVTSNDSDGPAETPESPAEVPASIIKLDRAEVVECAKNDIKLLKENGYYRVGFIATNAEFHVNREKRAVTVLLKGFKTNKVITKAVAKCDPQDCFNEHIGKAIALYRALKKDIPKIYTNTPQPEGRAQEGDIILYGDRELEVSYSWVPNKTAHPGSYAAAHSTTRIIDDSARY